MTVPNWMFCVDVERLEMPPAPTVKLNAPFRVYEAVGAEANVSELAPVSAAMVAVRLPAVPEKTTSSVVVGTVLEDQLPVSAHFIL